jgi:hypothetical protein
MRESIKSTAEDRVYRDMFTKGTAGKARKLIAKALEAKLAGLCSAHAEQRDE